LRTEADQLLDFGPLGLEVAPQDADAPGRGVQHPRQHFAAKEPFLERGTACYVRPGILVYLHFSSFRVRIQKPGEAYSLGKFGVTSFAARLPIYF
jgi:hypothetical protein